MASAKRVHGTCCILKTTSLGGLWSMQGSAHVGAMWQREQYDRWQHGDECGTHVASVISQKTDSTFLASLFKCAMDCLRAWGDVKAETRVVLENAMKHHRIRQLKHRGWLQGFDASIEQMKGGQTEALWLEGAEVDGAHCGWIGYSATWAELSLSRHFTGSAQLGLAHPNLWLGSAWGTDWATWASPALAQLWL